MRRERKACFGEMVHLDGSRHEWLALAPGEQQTLIQVVDDATSRLLYARLFSGETVVAIMTALWEVITFFGIQFSLYTDRAGWAFETPKAGGKVDKSHMTQVGEALRRLGVEHIPSYSPQARGRSERMNRTLQGRIVNELRAAGIETVEETNRYLWERYLKTHNESFVRPPRDPESAFVELGEVDLREIFFEGGVRTVGKHNTVSFEGTVLQVIPQPGRRSCSGLAVEMRRHLDGGYSIWRGKQFFGRYDSQGRALVLAQEKTSRQDGLDATISSRMDLSIHPEGRGNGATVRPCGSCRSCGKPETAPVSHKDLERRQTAPAPTATTGPSGGRSLRTNQKRKRKIHLSPTCPGPVVQDRSSPTDTPVTTCGLGIALFCSKLYLARTAPSRETCESRSRYRSR